VAFCSNCGRELSPAAQYCPHCGAATGLAVATTAVSTPPAPGSEGRLEGLALASLLCSVGSFFIIPIVGSILGIVFGHIAHGRIDADPTLRGREMARAGIIVGWIGIVLTVLAVLLIIVIAASFGHAFE
jgi:hypothetical protein